VRDASHDTPHVPLPQGTRCRTPDDENQSRVSTLPLPRKKLLAAATLVDRATVVENTGVYAVWLSPTCAASTSVSSRTIARSGLCSTARRTASSTVRTMVLSAAAAADCADAVDAAATTRNTRSVAIRSGDFADRSGVFPEPSGDCDARSGHFDVRSSFERSAKPRERGAKSPERSAKPPERSAKRPEGAKPAERTVFGSDFMMPPRDRECE